MLEGVTKSRTKMVPLPAVYTHLLDHFKIWSQFMLSSVCKHVHHRRSVSLKTITQGLPALNLPGLSHPLQTEDTKIRVTKVLFRNCKNTQVPAFTMSISRHCPKPQVPWFQETRALQTSHQVVTPLHTHPRWEQLPQEGTGGSTLGRSHLLTTGGELSLKQGWLSWNLTKPVLR